MEIVMVWSMRQKAMRHLVVHVGHINSKKTIARKVKR